MTQLPNVHLALLFKMNSRLHKRLSPPVLVLVRQPQSVTTDSTSIGPSISPSVHDDSEQAASQEATACPTTEQGKDRKTALRMYIAERFEQKPREAPVDEATLEKLAEARLNISFSGLPINPVILLLAKYYRHHSTPASDRKACHMQRSRPKNARESLERSGKLSIYS